MLFTVSASHFPPSIFLLYLLCNFCPVRTYLNTRLNARLIAFTALALAWAALPSLARETVLEDSPGRLVLEVEVPAYTVLPGAGGSRVSASGLGNSASTVGAPDLPQYDFSVAAGSRPAPSVSLEP